MNIETYRQHQLPPSSNARTLSYIVPLTTAVTASRTRRYALLVPVFQFHQWSDVNETRQRCSAASAISVWKLSLLNSFACPLAYSW